MPHARRTFRGQRDPLLLAGLLFPLAATPVASAAAGDPAPAALSISLSSSTVVGGNTVSGVVGLDSPAPAGGVILTLRSSSLAVARLSSPTGSHGADGTLVVTLAEGQRRALFSVRTLGVATATTIEVSVTSSASASAVALTVNPASVQSVTLSPDNVVGGGIISGTILLDGEAPPSGGAALALTVEPTRSTSPPGATLPAALPPTVTVAAGARSAQFTATTTPTSSRQALLVTAKLGLSTQATLTVLPPSLSSLRIVPTSVVGGTTARGTVTLNGAAPANGFVLNLAASDPAAQVPSSVSVPAGATTVDFDVATQAVTSPRSIVITRVGTGSGTIRDGTSNTIVVSETLATLQVIPLRITALQIGPPAAMFGGQTLHGAVILNGPVSRNTSAFLTSRDATLTLPHAVVIPAGSDRTTFTFAAGPVAAPLTATITASLQAPNQSIADGTSNTIQFGETSADASVSVAVHPLPQLQSLTVSPSPVEGGNAIALGLLVRSPAPANLGTPPITAALTVDRPDLVQLPKTILLARNPGANSTSDEITLIAAGKTVATPSDQIVTITASFDGRSVVAKLPVRAKVPLIASFTVRPTTAVGGINVIATIVLNRTSPQQPATLTTSRPDLITLPSSTVIGQGLQQSFTIGTAPVSAATTLTITLTVGTESVPVTLTLTPPLGGDEERARAGEIHPISCP